MVVNVRPLKRTKRRVTADLYDFHTFGAPGDVVASAFDGPFRENVKEFLARHARAAPAGARTVHALLTGGIGIGDPGLMAWRMTFGVGEAGGGVSPAAAVEMEVVEEDVTRSKSVYCDQCRVVGWSGHPVCHSRYHFIIRNINNPLPASQQACVHCGNLLPWTSLRCTVCSHEMATDEYHDKGYPKLDDPTHLLHGVVHTNGYGHLVRVNGREGGSKFLTGSHIMSFWDRICKMLRVRKITVMDVSKKCGMEYRLLHAITSGQPWYGNWGYEFGAGSFALTADAYQKAVNAISDIPLSVFFTHSRSSRTLLQDRIAFYWSFSNHKLVTVRDLFSYVMQLLHSAHEKCKSSNFAKGIEITAEYTSEALCSWTKEDMARAEDAMIKVLRAVSSARWVSLRALRGSAWLVVKSSELLDCCLKGLEGRRTSDGLIVAARCNAEANSTEYRLESAPTQQLPEQPICKPKLSIDHLERDLKFLYSCILNPETMDSYKPRAVRELMQSSAKKLLDCKQFIKDYGSVSSQWVPSNPFAISIWCHIEPFDDAASYNCAAPPELVTLPLIATVTDLKHETTKAFRETYLIFQQFRAEQLLDYGTVAETTPLKLLFGFNGTARIRGKLFDERRLGQFWMERGLENWIVDCQCGTKDDDGERMLACDACGVWQHTRCAGISDYEEVPAKFVCENCESKCKSNGGPAGLVGARCRESAPVAVRCKEEVALDISQMMADMDTSALLVDV